MRKWEYTPVLSIGNHRKRDTPRERCPGEHGKRYGKAERKGPPNGCPCVQQSFSWGGGGTLTDRTMVELGHDFVHVRFSGNFLASPCEIKYSCIHPRIFPFPVLDEKQAHYEKAGYWSDMEGSGVQNTWLRDTLCKNLAHFPHLISLSSLSTSVTKLDEQTLTSEFCIIFTCHKMLSSWALY